MYTYPKRKENVNECTLLLYTKINTVLTMLTKTKISKNKPPLDMNKEAKHKNKINTYMYTGGVE